MTNTYDTLRLANIARQAEWDTGKKLSLNFKVIELGGEVGEALNCLKKLEREALGLVGSRTTISDAAMELADVVICADLIGLHIDQPIRTEPMVQYAPAVKSSPTIMSFLGTEMMKEVGKVADCAYMHQHHGESPPQIALALNRLIVVVNRAFANLGSGVHSGLAVQTKFNQTSEKNNLKTRLQVKVEMST